MIQRHFIDVCKTVKEHQYEYKLGYRDRQYTSTHFEKKGANEPLMGVRGSGRSGQAFENKNDWNITPAVVT